MKLKKRKKKREDIERNNTNFYQLGRKKNNVILLISFLWEGIREKKSCVSSLVCVVYIQDNL